MNDQSSKVVLVTGASRGIGAAVAEHFVSLGWQVVGAARSETDLGAVATTLAGGDGQFHPVTCDVANAEDVERVFETVDRLGRIDLLVNNAGLIDPISRMEDADAAQWANVVDVNLTGAFRFMQNAGKRMIDQGEGMILNISSGAAYGPLEGWSHYCATKAALLMLTRCADKEWRQHGVRAVGLSPGTVATDMQTSIRASGINPVSQLDPDVHIPPEWVAIAIERLFNDATEEDLGQDFSLKDDAGRKRVGLPLH
ncbi:MAG: SDR family oxidoreductase [Pseudomonadota bacterium]